jgi:hypothetical protein
MYPVFPASNVEMLSTKANNSNPFSRLNKDLIEKILSFLSRSDHALAFGIHSNNAFLPYAKERVCETQQSLRLVCAKLRESEYPNIRSFLTEKIKEAESLKSSSDERELRHFLKPLRADLAERYASMDDQTAKRLLTDGTGAFGEDIYRCAQIIHLAQLQKDELPTNKWRAETGQVLECYLEHGLTKKAFQLLVSIPAPRIYCYNRTLHRDRVYRLIESSISEGNIERAGSVFLRYKKNNMMMPAIERGDISATRIILNYYPAHCRSSVRQRFVAASHATSLAIKKLLLPKEITQGPYASVNDLNTAEQMVDHPNDWINQPKILHEVLRFAAEQGSAEDVKFFLPKSKAH